ncbi:MAG: GNAT family N-acetyltransferase [Alphaproteobacteria bacterium]|jgi:ribosomal protein S18 acetylase RimI-like enzyme|nr:GNAT family N-acetyltransferase [Alphaproteobacteria bacterium]MDP6832054.1 GNAT family N-acetyltransferase [Alphaproteobacteria bacterium]MDP6873683.1 GNAT family N-acetyltransferase [Alphaproteobacteria bacterium]
MSGTATIFRDAVSGDLETVIRLDEIHTGLAKPDYWREMFQAYVAEEHFGRYFLIAETSNQIAGFIVGEIRTWEFGSPPCGWVFAVNVSPDCREGGIGSGLLDAVCSRFRDCGVSTVRTMVSRNDGLNLSFFRSQGMTAGPYMELEKSLERG